MLAMNAPTAKPSGTNERNKSVGKFVITPT